MEVQRILHQRALDVKLDPGLQRRCMTDLGKWCSEKTESGQELECLQDHLEDLVPDCREVVGNLTELESEVNPAESDHERAREKGRENISGLVPEQRPVVRTRTSLLLAGYPDGDTAHEGL